MLQKDSYRLMKYLSGQGINYWVLTLSFADICLAEERFDAEFLPELKAFLFCGEVLPCETALSLIKRFPDAKVINTYGPTESTVCVTEIQITEEMASGHELLSVGKVRPGTTIELDPDSSEIIIIGDTVSDGDPVEFLKNLNRHMATADQNHLIFIEKTGHTYQMKNQEVADLILSQIRKWKQ